jgi:hypothetical protein
MLAEAAGTTACVVDEAHWHDDTSAQALLFEAQDADRNTRHGGCRSGR